MIKLSKLSDYAIVVLGCLAAEQGQLQTAVVLARQTGIPEPTVAKVLKLLSKGDIVSSVRGVRGGYSLTRPAERISVAELIEALEGPISITSCAGNDVEFSCHISGSCPMSGGWGRVNHAIRMTLGGIYLAELLAPSRKVGGCHD